MGQQDTLFVASLEKGLRVLEVFRNQRENLGITDIAHATGFDKSTAQRFTTTLHRLGYLNRDERTRRYSPSIRLMDLAFTYSHQDRLAEIARPRLIEAGKRYNTSVNLCVLEGTDIIYTLCIPNQTASFMMTLSGRRAPALCLAEGICIIAFRRSDEIKAIVGASEITRFTEDTIINRSAIMRWIADAHSKGYGIGKGQISSDEISVAAPILDSTGVAFAAVQIPVFQPNWNLSDVESNLAPLVLDTARSLSRTLYRTT